MKIGSRFNSIILYILPGFAAGLFIAIIYYSALFHVIDKAFSFQAFSEFHSNAPISYFIDLLPFIFILGAIFLFSINAKEKLRFEELFEADEKKIRSAINIAKDLSLDIPDYKKCLDSDKVKELLKDNIDEANALDINGIPFVYINNQEVMGEIDLESLEKIIKIELNKEKIE